MSDSPAGDPQDALSRLDTTSAHSARVWNYLLGGKDHFAADRETGDLILKVFPGIAALARLQRRFLVRAVRYLAGVMLGIMGQLPDSDRPHELARRYLDALPAGSCLALCDGTTVSPALNEAIAAYNQNSASSYHLRVPEQIEAFFDGLTVVAPGIVPVSRWRGDSEDTAVEPAEEDATICGIGFKQ